MPKTRKKTKGTIRVRCLGPGREHTFWSRDRVTNRICEKCIIKMRPYTEEYRTILRE